MNVGSDVGRGGLCLHADDGQARNFLLTENARVGEQPIADCPIGAGLPHSWRSCRFDLDSNAKGFVEELLLSVAS